jgi:5-formyltetrahydrofolate cyclo-ligase
MKNEIRKKMRILLSLQSDEERQQKSINIAESLFSLDEYKGAQEIALYMAFGFEVHTHGIINAAFLSGKKVYVPRVDEKKKCISLHEISSLGDLVPGYMGIPEPKTCKDAFDPLKIQLVIVPGLAFDSRGRRLGRGKGMFDRLLRKMKCPKIALAFDFQVIEAVPRASHDVPVDLIVTEKRVIRKKAGI